MKIKMHEAGAAQFDATLIRRHDRNGPRYTSYPTADRFVEAFTADHYRHWLENRLVGGNNRPLSLYFHLPFCQNICYYCACNKIITKDHGRSAKYIRYLKKEMELVRNLLDDNSKVYQMHWGGGTPTFLSHDELRDLMAGIRTYFDLSPSGEYSIEIDPRRVDDPTIALLRELGFNRMSLGVQDFDPEVQKAINRVQTVEETMRVFEVARQTGFQSINMDLIYGLPKQNVIGFNKTLQLVIEAAPDRIALYSYAHLPTVFKPQRRIQDDDLPTAEAKLQLLTLAIRRLTDAGYVYIGMDHFAKPDDDLAVAQRKSQLQRNFQGYSTYANCDLLAFGISSIGMVGPTYVQNVKTLDEYYLRLDEGELPVLRGIELTADDLLRRTIIQTLMCNFALSVEAVETAYMIDFAQHFKRELAELRQFIDERLVRFDGQWLTVTERGRYLIRPICMVFDKYLRDKDRLANYSKVI